MPTLDSSQIKFCEAPLESNIRLLAPAGCGKTLCLLHRCKHIAQRVAPRRPQFLIVTFTRAASEELSKRINEDDDFEEIRDLVDVSTLNAWGYRRIKNSTRVYGNRLITSAREYHFTVANQLQHIWRNHQAILASIRNKNRRIASRAPRGLMDASDALKSLAFDHQRHTSRIAFNQHWGELSDQGLAWKLHATVDELANIDVVTLSPTPDDNERQEALFTGYFPFWIEATQHLIDNATFTLEDQKYYAYVDERMHIEKGAFLSGAAGYDHVIVDEFQDINPLDLQLIRAIVERRRATLTIAGDDDQAIFEWRGSSPEYIRKPERFIGLPFGTFTLGVNYRSPANVVHHSQRLINHNKHRVNKTIRSHISDPSHNAKIEVINTSSLNDDLNRVLDMVSTRPKGNDNQLALIGRKRSQIIPYQILFASKNIPFGAAEDLQLFLSKTFDRLLELMEVKNRVTDTQSRSRLTDDLLELCNLVRRYPLNRNDRERLLFDLNLLRARNILDSAAELSVESIQGNQAGLQVDQRRVFASAIEEFCRSNDVSTTLDVLSQKFVGLQYDFGKARDDIFYTDPPFLYLSEYAERYGQDFESFVEDIKAAKDKLVHVPPFEEDGDKLGANPVQLMTALRAKGKEFDTVVMLGAIDDIWPNRNAETEAEREAERRVFYVAFTRARKRVVIFTDKTGPPSPYIRELGLTIEVNP